MNEIMTETEAAVYVRRSKKTLQRRRAAGQIAFIQDGGILYKKSDLDEYLNQRRVAATQPPPPAPSPRYRKTGQNSKSNRQELFDII